jgi:glycosyltransferase involved in cell wall biosynthesis
LPEIKDFVGMPRVVHFIATNFVGGPEKQILNHLRLIQKQGWDAFIVSFDEPGGVDIKSESEKLGIECLLLPPDNKNILTTFKLFSSYMLDAKTDVLCAHGYKALFFSLLFKIKNRVKLIAFSRGWTSENIKILLYTLLDKTIIRFADKIVAVSHSQARKLRKIHIPKSKIIVIHNAVTLSNENEYTIQTNIRDELGVDSSKYIILTAGRLSPEKGHEDLLVALSKLPDKNDIILLLAGDGPLKTQLESKAEDLSLSEHVKFLGFRSDLYSLYQQVDLFVLPSHSEGLPNVILEAMFFQVPVISTDVGGVAEIIENNLNGLVVPSHDPENLSKAIQEMKNNNKLAINFVANANTTLQRKFSADHQTNAMLELYESLISQQVS